jgi:hypothetical protein
MGWHCGPSIYRKRGTYAVYHGRVSVRSVLTQKVIDGKTQYTRRRVTTGSFRICRDRQQTEGSG